jgi:protein O-GlcNAc transferase
MKKIISFSLWGDNPKYTIGAIRNAELAISVYPDWICRFYVGKSVPNNIIDSLKNIKNTEVIEMNEDGDWTGMFWRFLACEDSDVMLSRDTDSRLSLREKYAVDEWLASDKDFHIMRDHPYHTTAIMGGMWGCRNSILKNISELIFNYTKGNFWQVDQNFLKEVIYPLIKNNSFVHDEFFEKKAFPTQRLNLEFVGDVFDENDNRHPEYFKLIKN